MFEEKAGARFAVAIILSMAIACTGEPTEPLEVIDAGAELDAGRCFKPGPCSQLCYESCAWTHPCIEECQERNCAGELPTEVACVDAGASDA